MPNVMQVLRSEITRLARKEVKGSVTKVHKPTVQLKHDVAALKRTVAALVKATNIIQGVLEKIVAAQPVYADTRDFYPDPKAPSTRWSTGGARTYPLFGEATVAQSAQRETSIFIPTRG